MGTLFVTARDERVTFRRSNGRNERHIPKSGCYVLVWKFVPLPISGKWKEREE
jgi:hypothetical protein